ncbi:MAG: hypothetical protein M1834_006722 [Cirrosporium novae-zelandiae]|nr:MAG: hypothetical protein M1834_006722 [Cirrosporium novae-zelandiae]
MAPLIGNSLSTTRRSSPVFPIVPSFDLISRSAKISRRSQLPKRREVLFTVNGSDHENNLISGPKKSAVCIDSEKSNSEQNPNALNIKEPNSEALVGNGQAYQPVQNPETQRDLTTVVGNNSNFQSPGSSQANMPPFGYDDAHDTSATTYTTEDLSNSQTSMDTNLLPCPGAHVHQPNHSQSHFQFYGAYGPPPEFNGPAPTFGFQDVQSPLSPARTTPSVPSRGFHEFGQRLPQSPPEMFEEIGDGIPSAPCVRIPFQHPIYPFPEPTGYFNQSDHQFPGTQIVNDKRFIGFDLVQYLLGQFESGAYTDYTLTLSSSSQQFDDVQYRIHGVIAPRSPILNMEMVAHSKKLMIKSSSRFIRPAYFETAIRCLYGENPLWNGPFEAIARGSNTLPYYSKFSEELLDMALGYAAAGRCLGLFGLVDGALSVVMSLANWRNIDKILACAFEGVADYPEDTVEDLAPVLTRIRCVYEHLLYSARLFLLDRFPDSFTFTPSARLTHMLPLFPSYKDSPLDPDTQVIQTPGTHTNGVKSPTNPRVFSLRFGSLPPAVNSPENKVLSTILVNLPFADLRWMVQNSKHISGREEIWKDVIEEREKRRLKLVEDGHADPDNEQAPINWKEDMVRNVKELSEWSIARTFVGDKKGD